MSAGAAAALPLSPRLLLQRARGSPGPRTGPRAAARTPRPSPSSGRPRRRGARGSAVRLRRARGLLPDGRREGGSGTPARLAGRVSAWGGPRVP